ncbi:MAG: hypothetical protein FWG66_06105 [Spirochaetes bacterium]|nr:hypothetical protein [Spirochaetota bacterium]
MEKVLLDELESDEDNMLANVTYKGEPFTGTAYEESAARGYEEYRFVNGFGHGRGFWVAPNGQLRYEIFAEKGKTIEETQWHASGAKQRYFRAAPILEHYWNEEGALVFERIDGKETQWYPGGALKSEFVKKKEKTYFRENGDWAVKIKTAEDFVVLEKDKMVFNKPCLDGHYMELLQDHDFYKYALIWLGDLEPGKQEEVVCKMIQSDVLWHKYEGINLAFIKLKRKIYSAVPYIKLEINNHEKPPRIDDLTGGSQGFAHTIAERAALALAELEA